MGTYNIGQYLHLSLSVNKRRLWTYIKIPNIRFDSCDEVERFRCLECDLDLCEGCTKVALLIEMTLEKE